MACLITVSCRILSRIRSKRSTDLHRSEIQSDKRVKWSVIEVSYFGEVRFNELNSCQPNSEQAMPDGPRSTYLTLLLIIRITATRPTLSLAHAPTITDASVALASIRDGDSVLRCSGRYVTFLVAVFLATEVAGGNFPRKGTIYRF